QAIFGSSGGGQHVTQIGLGAVGGTATSPTFIHNLSGNIIKFACGGGGGNCSGGPGGKGGGALYVECGGAWNFTTVNGISVAGTTGSNGSANGNGGAGGGGAGTFTALYNALSANTGTVNVSGGQGGTGTTTGGVG